MTLVDFGIVVVITLAAARGAYRGGVAEVFGPVALVVALLIAARYARGLEGMLEGWLVLDDAPLLLAAGGFVGLFLIAYSALCLLGWSIGRGPLGSIAGVVNRSLGAALGGVKWAFVLALSLMFLSGASRPIGHLQSLESSKVFAALKEYGKRPIQVTSRSGVGRED